MLHYYTTKFEGFPSKFVVERVAIPPPPKGGGFLAPKVVKRTPTE